MRLLGVVPSAAGLVPLAHLCWVFTDREEFRTRAAEFLHDGISGGQHVEFVGQGSTGELTEQVHHLLGDPGPGVGQVGVCPVEEFFVTAAPAVVDPVASVHQCLAALEKALADGFSALRAVVDATSLVQTPTARAAFAQFEHLIDVEMSRLPISAMCAYDATRIEARTIAHLASLHPQSSPGTGTLRVYADGEAAFGLAGEADASTAQTVEDTMATVLSLLDDDGAQVRIGTTGLRFVDHHALLRLDDVLAAAGRTALLPTSAATLATLGRLLPLRALRVEAVPTEEVPTS